MEKINDNTFLVYGDFYTDMYMDNRIKEIIDDNFDFFIFKLQSITEEEMEYDDTREEMRYVNQKLRGKKLKEIEFNIGNQTLRKKIKKL